MIAGQEVPKGYWLVDTQWYKLVQTSHRGYELVKEKIKLNVHAMVRLPEPIEFEKVKTRRATAAPASERPPRAAAQAGEQARQQGQPPSKQREKPNLLSEQTHNGILVNLADHRL